MLPDDLKSYKAPSGGLGAFQIIEEGTAILFLLALAVLLFILWPYIQ